LFLEQLEERQPSFLMRNGAKVLAAKMHAGAWEPQPFTPLPVHIPMPHQKDVGRTAAILAGAQRPLLLVGSQATLLGPQGTQRLREAVEALGLPAFLGGMARGLLGRNHKLHIRQNRGQALKKVRGAGRGARGAWCGG
jgi:acetolactate synthase-like protein